MRAHHRTRAFAIDVQIADMEFAHRAFDLVARAGVNRASQAELGVIGDIERVIEVREL